jgi:CSLREA domain-containing protein
VNSTADELIASNGQCTLREAVINANGDADTTGGDCPAGSGADLINVPAGTYVLAIPGASENAAARAISTSQPISRSAAPVPRLPRSFKPPRTWWWRSRVRTS